jgi:hypothetical protein
VPSAGGYYKLEPLPPVGYPGGYLNPGGYPNPGGGYPKAPGPPASKGGGAGGNGPKAALAPLKRGAGSTATALPAASLPTNHPGVPGPPSAVGRAAAAKPTAATAAAAQPAAAVAPRVRPVGRDWADYLRPELFGRSFGLVLLSHHCWRGDLADGAAQSGDGGRLKRRVRGRLRADLPPRLSCPNRRRHGWRRRK